MMKNAEGSKEKRGFLSSLFDTVKVKVRVRHEDLFTLRQRYPKRIIYVDRQYRVRGRHKGTFAIIGSADGGQSLYIEGSIPKYLTGQNLIGHENLQLGATELVTEVLRRARIEPTPREAQAYKAGDFELLRVDYANHLSCGSEQAAQHFMTALRRRTAAKPWAYSAYQTETLYWGQHSCRRTLKAYDKGREIVAHPLGSRVRSAEALSKKAVGLIRFELCLRADELKRLDLRRPDAWSPEVARRLLNEKVAEVVPVEGQMPDPKLMDGLSRTLRVRLELWLRGAPDAFTRYPGALAANRREVLEKTGIDITSVLTAEEQANAFVTLQAVFKNGWEFHSWERMWEKMKAGSED